MNRKYLVAGLGFVTLFLLINSVSAAIDTTKIGVAVGEKFTYESKSFVSGSSEETGFGNGTLVLEVLGLPDSDNLADASLTFPNGTTEEGHVNMTALGDFFIYTDWDYWTGDEASLGFFEGANVTDDGNSVEFSYLLDAFGISFEYTARYRKSNGVLELFNFTSSGFGSYSNFYYGLIESKAEGESTPGFELIALASLPIVAMIASRKRRME
ncbi:MAG: hypothetical protein D6732_02000 [Methanobacteriota archaeon]|nr:MAG: hypothetical protein D6732_02000 [Euryarchaeota archaeon]